ncbi:MAG: CHAD domain-containing protein [Candidatus Latescibacteria bacterium]|nr:CHAD domain-containing protein [Candidatus Latescibacterota bacterium]
MDFRLHRDEPLPAGLRRLAAHQLDKAIGRLLAGGEYPDEEIHEARKALKRLRALVCLARADLGAEAMRWEHRSLGLTARLLAGMRDAAALVECLDHLEGWSGRAHPRVRAWLVERQGQTAVRGQAGSEAVDALRWAQVRLEGWPLQREGWEALGPGLRWVYGRGRRSLRLACSEGGEARFHQWRRYVKYWWYHTQVLHGLWPAMMEALEAELDRLGELLGADHDLAVLAALLEAEWPARRSRIEVRRLAGLILRRQAELQAEALELGARLYAESPRALAGRWGRYWAAWKGQRASEI